MAYDLYLFTPYRSTWVGTYRTREQAEAYYERLMRGYGYLNPQRPTPIYVYTRKKA